MCDIIGIDLGTTFCSCGYCLNDKVECMEIEGGKKMLPSVVEYESLNNPIIGSGAVNHMTIGKKNIVYDSKRYIGKKYDEIDKEYLKNCSYNIINKYGLAYFKLDNEEEISPTKISSDILKFIIKEAKEKIVDAKNLKDAVITVPAYFKNEERNETRKAGEEAGINVLKLINEPTAAAIAYVYENNSIEGQSLIYDFGGGTFDVSIIEVINNKIKVLSTNGDDRLGGQDITNTLLNYVLDKAEKEEDFYINRKNEKGKKKLTKIRKRVNEAKLLLSESTKTEIEINDDIIIELTRAELNDVCHELFERTIKIVDETINNLQNIYNEINKKLPKKEKKVNIKRIILVGGSSNIPYISELLKKTYKYNILESINKNEAVCLGAGYYSYSLKYPEKAKFMISDILNTTIGLESCDEKGKHFYYRLLKKNCELPCESDIQCKSMQGCNDAVVTVYEGEDDNISNNRQLGKIIIEVDTTESVLINVKLTINTDGILEVKATGNGKEIKSTLAF